MSVLPFLDCISSGHSFPPLIAGLVTILYLNEVPVASGADQSDQSDTIHGSGAEKNIKVNILWFTCNSLTRLQTHVNLFADFLFVCIT